MYGLSKKILKTASSDCLDQVSTNFKSSVTLNQHSQPQMSMEAQDQTECAMPGSAVQFILIPS